MSETANWYLRPRVLIGMLLFVIIFLYLVGWHNHAMKQKKGTAKATSKQAGSTGKPAKKPRRNVLGALPVVKVEIAGHPFKLWLASTLAEKKAGLMQVNHLASDRGMLFLFHTAKPETFWMKNTPIPLDLVFLDGATVGRIYTMKPMNSKLLYSSKQPVTAAIELQAGICAKLGLKPGDQIKLPVSAE